MSETSVNLSQINGGYVCSKCGRWVVDGIYHYCGGETTPIYPYPPYPDERLYKLLEEIRDALLKLNPK